MPGTHKHRAHYKYVECYLNNLTEINDRLKNRERMISQINKVESQKEFLAAIENSKRPLNREYLVIDSGQPLDSYIYTVLEYISR
ncbi:ATP-binding protein [Heyndrickxia sporothermodurans]